METQPPHRELRSPGVSQSSFPVTDGDGWQSSVVSLLWHWLLLEPIKTLASTEPPRPMPYARIAKQVLSCFLWPFATKQCRLFTEWFIVTLSFVLALKTINLGSHPGRMWTINFSAARAPASGALETVPMISRWKGGAPQADEFSGCSLQKSDSKSSQKSAWTISSFSGNFNLQPSQVSCRAQQVQSQFLELVQSRAKEPKLIPSLRLAYVPLALSRRIGFIGLLQTAWDSSLVAKRFGCKLLGCKRTGLALIEASKEHFRHLFPVSNTNISMGFVE